jgi:hypothetical protein
MPERNAQGIITCINKYRELICIFAIEAIFIFRNSILVYFYILLYLLFFTFFIVIFYLICIPSYFWPSRFWYFSLYIYVQIVGLKELYEMFHLQMGHFSVLKGHERISDTLKCEGGTEQYEQVQSWKILKYFDIFMDIYLYF